MSYSYSTEPPTNGKVVIKTTGGDLEVELWGKETPKAVRNFLQLAMDKEYDNALFYRLIPKFLIQGGPVSNQSSYGQDFQDEFHSRLKFNRRGLLAYANSGPDSNKSHFFFTLGPTPALNGENTIFGKVVGDTIYNLVQMGEGDVDTDDAPLNPIRILEIDILVNPFDDMFPKEKPVEEVKSLEKDAGKKSKLGVKYGFFTDYRNLKLLSFEEDENQSSNIKIKSSHDVLKEDLRLSKRTLSSDSDDSSQEEEVSQKESRKKVKELLPSEKRLESLKDQVSLMKAELRGKLKPKEEKIVPKVIKHVSLVDQIRNDYLKSGKVTVGKMSKKADKSFLQMETFKSILHEKTATATKKKPEEKVQQECKLHLIKNCASCFDQFGVIDQDDDDDDDWMNASLVFKKDVGANVYQPKPDDYTVIDPRIDVTRNVDIFGKNAPSEKKAWSERAIKANRKDSQSTSYSNAKR